MGKIEILVKERKNGNEEKVNLFDMEKTKKVVKFHSSFNEYKPTPLVNLAGLADEIGVATIYVKDESKRFDLNAFKVLGGSYGIANGIAERLGLDIDDITIEKLKSPEIKEQLQGITFATATDGNHGRGIAWAARELGCKAVIYMPHGAVQRRINHIENLGATVHKMDMNFDDTARHAFQQAKENGWMMVQDTTFDGYTDFPTWCMQGYTTMSYEVYKELVQQDVMPTHIFIQAGAGSLAGSVAGFFGSAYGKNRPILTTIEADTCGCLKATAEANDGKLHAVKGDLETIMAGLSVGEACSVGWEILDTYADAHAICSDSISALGMRVLAAPTGNDEKIISGESGSVGIGLLMEVMTKDEYSDFREKLKLDKDSVILFFNTEGDTDPENYKKVVWGGAHPNV